MPFWSVATPSETWTVNEYEPKVMSSGGVHVNTPVDGSMAAPAGAPSSENVSVWAGRSGSVAVAVNVSRLASWTVVNAGTPLNVGATLTSFTVTVIGASALAIPSETRTLNVTVPSSSSSVGVQVNAPVDGLMLAPDGAPTRLNVSVWAGRSGSVLVAVKVSVVSSSMVAELTTPVFVAAMLYSLTVIVIAECAVSIQSEARTGDG